MTLRLSEAILLGSTSVRPLAGHMIKFQNGETFGCALGMACTSAAVPFFKSQKIYDEWPWLREWFTLPCCCGSGGYFACSVIVHIFDCHVMEVNKPHWTLEQLVDWVRSVEPPEPDQEQATGVSGRDPLETNQDFRSVEEKISL